MIPLLVAVLLAGAAWVAGSAPARARWERTSHRRPAGPTSDPSAGPPARVAGVVAAAVSRVPGGRRLVGSVLVGQHPPDLLAGVVGELSALVRAGVGPAAAWGHVEVGGPISSLVRAAAGAGAAGASVADVLAAGGSGAAAPGVAPEDLRALAAAWRVLELTGAPAADVLDRLAGSLRDAADVRASRRTAVAAPRATARVLAVLPVLGLGLGQLVGSDPLGVLLGTPAGRVSAVAGLVLTVVAVLWTRALVRAAVGTA